MSSVAHTEASLYVHDFGVYVLLLQKVPYFHLMATNSTWCPHRLLMVCFLGIVVDFPSELAVSILSKIINQSTNHIFIPPPLPNHDQQIELFDCLDNFCVVFGT